MKLLRWLCSLSLLASPVLAQETNSEPVLPVDVTATVTKGVNYLRTINAKTDGNWLFPPLESNKVIGWKTNNVHFKEIQITIPGYKYENYEVLLPGSSPTDPLRRVTRSRIVGLDPSKDRKETRIVQDPNGPIIRPTAIPIYEKESAVQWAYGALGNNAMAIVALRRCGVRGDDPLVNQPAERLIQIVTQYGLPDNLMDLAWLTAGFAVMPGDEFKKWTERCAVKLLDAQITSGPAAGLWGPVAVNPAMVSAFLRVMSRWGDERRALQAELLQEQKKNPKGKASVKANRLEDDLRKLTARITALQDEVPRLTQQGLLMFDVFGARNFGRIRLNFQGDYIVVESLPYLIQNQISADLDSTALALLAIRIAFENGRLPAKTWRPDTGKLQAAPGAPPVSDFPPARSTREVLDLATRALTAARTPAGQWPELNIHLPVTDFAWLKSIPQINPEAFPRLPQPITLPSICRGAGSLANIQMLMTGQARGTALETEACRPLVHSLVRGQLSLLATNDVRSPFDMLPHLTAARTGRGKVLRNDFTTWNELAEWLSQKQIAKDGNWGREKVKLSMPSTSLRELQQVIPPIDHEPADPSANRMSKNYDKPHINPGYFMKGHLAHRHGASEAAYFTTTALLFLADGIPEDWTPPLPAVVEATP